MIKTFIVCRFHQHRLQPETPMISYRLVGEVFIFHSLASRDIGGHATARETTLSKEFGVLQIRFPFTDVASSWPDAVLTQTLSTLRVYHFP